MPEDHIWSAAELEVLTPDERARIVRAGFVSKVEDMPSHLVERAVAKIEQRSGVTDQ